MTGKEAAEFIEKMTNKEAAEVLKNVKFWMNSGRRNGKIYLSLAYDKSIDLAIKALEERPQGEWLPFTYNYDLIEPSEYGSYVQILKDEKETHWEEYWAPEFVCSKCHAKNHKSNFCPYCGADMKGGAE